MKKKIQVINKVLKLSDVRAWGGEWSSIDIFFNRSRIHLPGMLLHTHKNFMEIFIVDSSSVIHHINGMEMELNAGSMVFIRPDDRHAFEKKAGEKGFAEIICIVIPMPTYHAMASFLKNKDKLDALFQSEFPPVFQLTDNEKKDIIYRLESTRKYFISNPSSLAAHSKIVLMDIFTRFVIDRTPTMLDSSIPEWVENVKTRMMEHDNFVAGLKRMRQIACHSYEYLCRVFCKYYSETPTEFINRIRVEYAASLLITTNDKILNIAADVGFKGIGHFYRAFSKRFGISPAKYRKKYLQVFQQNL